MFRSLFRSSAASS